MIIMQALYFLYGEENIVAQAYIKKMLPITQELEYSQIWNFYSLQIIWTFTINKIQWKVMTRFFKIFKKS